MMEGKTGRARERAAGVRPRWAIAALVGSAVLFPSGAGAATNGRILYATGIPADAVPSGDLITVDPSSPADKRPVGIATFTQAPSPDWSPDGGRIAYSAGDDAGGPSDVFTANSDGTDVRLLAGGPEDEQAPAWSPDGGRIAYTSGEYKFLGYAPSHSEIHVSRVGGGGGPVRLSADGAADFSPAWSPDGTRIVFASARTGSREIYLMNADGSGVQRLTNDRDEDDFPAFSPDGTKIAWSSDVDFASGDVWVMAADGRQPAQLTRGTEADWDPEWSPDGRAIAFERNVTPVPWAHFSSVHVMNADGTDRRELVRDAFQPSWQALEPGAAVPPAPASGTPGTAGGPASGAVLSEAVAGSTVSARQARRQLKRLLADRYRSFRNRRSLVVKCHPRANGKAQLCAVRWSTLSKKLSARVRVGSSGSGYDVRVIRLRVERKRG